MRIFFYYIIVKVNRGSTCISRGDDNKNDWLVIVVEKILCMKNGFGIKMVLKSNAIEIVFKPLVLFRISSQLSQSVPLWLQFIHDILSADGVVLKVG